MTDCHDSSVEQIGASSGHEHPSPDELTCAICLGQIPPPDLAMVAGCEHLYCVHCILSWALCKETPSCPQCKHKFEHLYVHRMLDGTITDFPVRESVCLLARAKWFEDQYQAAERGKASSASYVIPDAPGGSGSVGPDGRVDAFYEDYEIEEDEEDELVEYYYSSASGRAKVLLGNRRFGENGYMQSGRRYARPIAPPPPSGKKPAHNKQQQQQQQSPPGGRAWGPASKKHAGSPPGPSSWPGASGSGAGSSSTENNSPNRRNSRKVSGLGAASSSAAASSFAAAATSSAVLCGSPSATAGVASATGAKADSTSVPAELAASPPQCVGAITEPNPGSVIHRGPQSLAVRSCSTLVQVQTCGEDGPLGPGSGLWDEEEPEVGGVGGTAVGDGADLALLSALSCLELQGGGTAGAAPNSGKGELAGSGSGSSLNPLEEFPPLSAGENPQGSGERCKASGGRMAGATGGGMAVASGPATIAAAARGTAASRAGGSGSDGGSGGGANSSGGGSGSLGKVVMGRRAKRSARRYAADSYGAYEDDDGFF